MNKISRERFDWLKQKHYELWDWLSKNPDKQKWEWEEFDNIELIDLYCFACQFVVEVAALNDCLNDCDFCPLGRENIGCGCGLFNHWEDCEVLQWRTELAEQIRDLEWSDEYVRGEVNE